MIFSVKVASLDKQMKRPNKTKQNKKTPPNCHFWRAGSQNRGSEQKQCIAYTSICNLQCRRPQFNLWVRKIAWKRDRLPTPVFLGFPGGSAGKESTCNVVDLGSIPGLGRSSGEGNSYTHSSILAWRIPWTVQSLRTV